MTDLQYNLEIIYVYKNTFISSLNIFKYILCAKEYEVRKKKHFLNNLQENHEIVVNTLQRIKIGRCDIDVISMLCGG